MGEIQFSLNGGKTSAYNNRKHWDNSLLFKRLSTLFRSLFIFSTSLPYYFIREYLLFLFIHFFAVVFYFSDSILFNSWLPHLRTKCMYTVKGYECATFCCHLILPLRYL